MDERGYKENLKKLVLDIIKNEFDNYSSQKGVKKYFEGNIDKVIDENINKINKGNNAMYLRIMKSGSSQENISSIAKIIKSEQIFKSKSELIRFAKYLGIDMNRKYSYNQILRKISSHIYTNRKNYSNKYFLYKRGNKEYILEPNTIKLDLIESYKSKTRNDMSSIAKLLNVNIEEHDSAEEIRKKLINHIMKEKIGKNK